MVPEVMTYNHARKPSPKSKSNLDGKKEHLSFVKYRYLTLLILVIAD